MSYKEHKIIMVNWKFWENWGKPKPSKKSELELTNHLNQVLDASRKYSKDQKENSRAENVLLQIETFLREMLIELKRLTESHERRVAEMEANHKLLMENEKEAYAKEKKQISKMENQMILIYDYWYREVEIQKLTNQIKAMSLSSDRKALTAKLDRLTLKNAGLEEGIKKRDIDPERIIELRRKIGIYESNE